MDEINIEQYNIPKEFTQEKFYRNMRYEINSILGFCKKRIFNTPSESHRWARDLAYEKDYHHDKIKNVVKRIKSSKNRNKQQMLYIKYDKKHVEIFVSEYEDCGDNCILISSLNLFGFNLKHVEDIISRIKISPQIMKEDNVLIEVSTHETV